MSSGIYGEERDPAAQAAEGARAAVCAVAPGARGREPAVRGACGTRGAHRGVPAVLRPSLWRVPKHGMQPVQPAEAGGALQAAL